LVKASICTANVISDQLARLADPKIAQHSQRFFKTGKGEYGEGDQFLGIRVPPLRALAKEHQDIALLEVAKLLNSPFHESRLCAALLLVYKFSVADSVGREAIYDFYLANTGAINNWDLVDCSAHHIVGGHLFDKERDLLCTMASSSVLWERRIAMMATFYFIRHNQFSDALSLAEQLLEDKEDLIHKVVGWMLREIGKRDEGTEKRFLKTHYDKMPRTMLRYAIEKFPAAERKRYLAGTA